MNKSASKFRRRLAMGLLAVFAIHALLRLAALIPIYRLGKLSVPFHALALVLFTTGAGWLLVRFRGKPLIQVAVAAVVSVTAMCLASYDGIALVTARTMHRVMPLASIADFYCGDASLGQCAATYWPQTLLAVGVTVLLACVIFLCRNELAELTERSWQRIAARFGQRLPRLGLVALAVAYAAAWLLFPAAATQREPLVRFATERELAPAPRALMTRPKPQFSVVPSPDVHPRSLVIITVDSLRADSIQLGLGKPSLTPFLQSLAQRGELVDLGPATAACPNSYCGIVALQSSSDWAKLEAGPPLMLADVLAANGYSTHFLLGGPHRTAFNLGDLYGPNLTTVLDDASPDSSGLGDDREQVRRLKALKIADPARAYLSIHLMSAHAAGLRFDPGGREPSLLDVVVSKFRPGANDYASEYRRGVRQADGIIRELFVELERKGLLNGALVIITADHGERIDAGAHLGHGAPIDPVTAAIPLLVFDARQAEWPAQSVASQIDVAPTLLAAANIAVPASFVGQPLQQHLARRAAPIDTLRSTGLVAVLQGHRVFLRCEVRSGRTVAMPFGAVGLSDAKRKAMLAQAPGLRAGLKRRSDAQVCF